MAATQEVIRSVDSEFQVAVCPYEGGSDHTVFLMENIPAVLTWHFTDYVYHTTVDTLDKASAREMENVSITSLAAGYLAAKADETETMEMMKIVYDAAVERFETEAQNTVNHFDWTIAKNKSLNDAIELETEVLASWADWYIDALKSCGDYFLEERSPAYQVLEDEYIGKIEEMLENALKFSVFAPNGIVEDITVANVMIVGDYAFELGDDSYTLNNYLTAAKTVYNNGERNEIYYFTGSQWYDLVLADEQGEGLTENVIIDAQKVNGTGSYKYLNMISIDE